MQGRLEVESIELGESTLAGYPIIEHRTLQDGAVDPAVTTLFGGTLSARNRCTELVVLLQDLAQSRCVPRRWHRWIHSEHGQHEEMNR